MVDLLGREALAEVNEELEFLEEPLIEPTYALNSPWRLPRISGISNKRKPCTLQEYLRLGLSFSILVGI